MLSRALRRFKSASGDHLRQGGGLFGVGDEEKQGNFEKF